MGRAEDRENLHTPERQIAAAVVAGKSTANLQFSFLQRERTRRCEHFQYFQKNDLKRHRCQFLTTAPSAALVERYFGRLTP